MDIDPIIAAIKARCPSFAGRVAGSAEYAALPEAAKMAMPAAYVIPMDDEAGEQESANGYKQAVREVFAVIAVLSNTTDERGKAAISTIHSLRTELFSALLAWAPDEEHDIIEYERGQLLHVDRARLYYQFEFRTETELREADTYQAVANDALPAFTEMGIDVDTIDPHDPNLGSSGPDGTIEVKVDPIPIEQ